MILFPDDLTQPSTDRDFAPCFRNSTVVIALRTLVFLMLGAVVLLAQEEIPIIKDIAPGSTKPVWVNLSGISGEAAQVLQFDLYVQGFGFTNAESAQYLISGSADGNLQARATDRFNKSTLVAKAYSGASLRRQVHAFADDFVKALNGKGIAQSKIAFKGETGGGNGEIFISDFDGFGVQPVTADNTIVAAPCWVPRHMALYYTSYKKGNPDIFFHDLSSGARSTFAAYGGANISPAASPDGSKIAMILSKDGWTDLYVANADRSGLKRLTKSPQDESSPCWSPDGQWICYAAKDHERRALKKISVNGGEPQVIQTGGAGNPTEPDWSPDGKWIAFTVQFRDFAIFVVPASGGTAIQLAEGEDPSWAPNSRTLAIVRRQGGHYSLALLDMPTKQVKDVSRISGSNSQSQPSWAR
jgi:TolB protein